MRRLLGALAVALVAFGCAGKKPIIPPDKLWGEAEDAFKIEAYELAVDRYKKLLDQHPFDQHAEEAELKIALSYYKAQRWAEAIAAFGDFERMHPTSAELPAVEYHLGMAYLAQASTSDRDQQSHANALTYFRNLSDPGHRQCNHPPKDISGQVQTHGQRGHRDQAFEHHRHPGLIQMIVQLKQPVKDIAY